MRWPASSVGPDGGSVVRARRALRACGILLVATAGVTAACSSLSPRGAGGPAGAEGPDLARGLKARGLDPATVVVPWELNGAMREWAHRQVSDSLPADQRLDRLLAALLGSDGLALEYKAGATATAQEVFASHTANCLAFTSLFVGLARELGIGAFFLDVGDIEKYEREGNLVVESGHITAGFGAGSLLRILEFTPIGKPNYRQLHRISDQTAIALYYSNRGAELLRAGKEREALDWLRKAVVIDPEMARGWINYGVALRRTGDAAAAEAAYRKALDSDPSAVAAYQNLASLLFAYGRGREGEELMALSSKLDNRNPFNYLSLGDVALAHGRTEEARRFYRKAQRLEGAEAESAAALGQLALAAGNRGEARRWLRKAAARDSGNERVQRLAAQLGVSVARQAPRAPASPAGPAPGASGAGTAASALASVPRTPAIAAPGVAAPGVAVPTSAGTALAPAGSSPVPGGVPASAGAPAPAAGGHATASPALPAAPAAPAGAPPPPPLEARPPA
jgi:Flp pilus assembly protein TadD